MSIRVLIVDDHQLFREGLCALMDKEADLEMVGELCERVVLLDEGRVAADGPASQILGDATLLRDHGLR